NENKLVNRQWFVPVGVIAMGDVRYCFGAYYFPYPAAIFVLLDLAFSQFLLQFRDPADLFLTESRINGCCWRRTRSFTGCLVYIYAGKPSFAGLIEWCATEIFRSLPVFFDEVYGGKFF